MTARSGRFSIIPARAIDDPRLGNAALLVLCALGTYSDRDGWSWPTVATLCNRLRLTRRPVLRHLRQLQDLDYLGIEPRFDDKGRQRSNKYRVLHDGDLPADLWEREGGSGGHPERTHKERTNKHTSDSSPYLNTADLAFSKIQSIVGDSSSARMKVKCSRSHWIVTRKSISDMRGLGPSQNGCSRYFSESLAICSSGGFSNEHTAKRQPNWRARLTINASTNSDLPAPGIPVTTDSSPSRIFMCWSRDAQPVESERRGPSR